MKIYKYCKFDSYLLNTLITNKIWHSHYSELNDPFEAKLHVVNDLEIEELEQLYEIIFNKYKENGEKRDFTFIIDECKKNATEYGEYNDNDIGQESYISEISHSICNILIQNMPKKGIAAFSKRCDVSLMWSHYADKHKGICIEFDTSKFIPEVKPIKVNYNKLQNNIYKTSELVDFFSNNPNDLSEIFYKLTENKQEFWNYEEEYRLISDIKENKGDSIYVGEAVSSIIFGLQCPPEIISTIITMMKIREPKISFYKTRIDNNSFKLIKDELEPESDYIIHERSSDGDINAWFQIEEYED